MALKEKKCIQPMDIGLLMEILFGHFSFCCVCQIKRVVVQYLM